MACSSCSKKKKSIVIPRDVAPSGYVEGDTGYVTIVYTGTVVVRVRGKCTNHIYLFGVGAKRLMDKCDAEEIDKLRDFYILKEEPVVEELVEETVVDNPGTDISEEDTDS